MIQPLTKRQKQVFDCLSRGMSYASIAQSLNISRANLHVICWQIRKKTGIKSTKDRVTLREVSRHNSAKKHLQPSKMQNAVLSLIAQGAPYSEISLSLGIRPQTAQNHAFLGFRRLGISAGPSRICALRIALGIDAHEEKSAVVTMDDPFFN